MDWTAPLDEYCERGGPGLLAEPLNLASNLAFIVAAGFALRLYLRRRTERDAGIVVLIALMFAIGVGSALYHSFANLWSMYADVVPITLLIYFCFGYYLRRIAGWPWGRIALAYVGFLALSAATARIPWAWLNGSQAYFGALIALLVLAPLGRKCDPALPRRMTQAAAVFAVSLLFRSIDIAVCEPLPMGSHFLWHLLNGLLLFLVLRAVIEAGAPRATGRAFVTGRSRTGS